MKIVPVITGVCPVVGVPFSETGDVHLGDVERMVEYLLRTDIGGIMFPGYASEFLKLDDGERSAIEELLVKMTSGTNVSIVLSVNDHATRSAVARARRLVDAGADAVNLLPPWQLGASAGDVRAHITSVASAIAPAPVVIQHAPNQTGSALDADTVRALVLETPNVRQVKVESSPPGRMIAALADGDPGVPAAVGYAGLHMIDALERGAVCVQPGSSFVELYLAIWSRWQRGDDEDARDLHTRLTPYLAYWMQNIELLVAAEKLISYRRGLITTPKCRRPGWDLDALEVALVDRFLTEFCDTLMSESIA
jgi:4-hydroxy-tetrahydrodipicolinate synthase